MLSMCASCCMPCVTQSTVLFPARSLLLRHCLVFLAVPRVLCVRHAWRCSGCVCVTPVLRLMALLRAGVFIHKHLCFIFSFVVSGIVCEIVSALVNTAACVFASPHCHHSWWHIAMANAEVMATACVLCLLSLHART